MTCPYCETELKPGTLNWHSGNMTWLPEGVRPPQRDGEYIEGAVQLEQSYNGLRPNLEASYCARCRKIVIDL